MIPHKTLWAFGLGRFFLEVADTRHLNGSPRSQKLFEMRKDEEGNACWFFGPIFGADLCLVVS